MRQFALASIAILALWSMQAETVAAMESGCQGATESALTAHLMRAELRHGESDELKDEAIGGVMACLRDNAACVAMTVPSDGHQVLELRSASRLGAPLDEGHDHRHNVLFAVIAVDHPSAGPPGCVAAVRLMVNAMPWWVMGWSTDDGTTRTNDRLATEFPAFTMGMQPEGLVAAMREAYQRWQSR